MKEFLPLLAFAATAISSLEAEEFRYEADWDSIRSHWEVPEWFRDAKLGIFLHWGPYTVPAYGVTKYPKYMYYEGWKSKKGEPLFDYHLETYGPQSDFGYKDFIPQFKAEAFDAEEWVALFKEAGARYIVPVAEHHDGFAMYDSKHTKWNAKKMGPKRDTLRELADATRAAGLKFGVSSHLAVNRRYYSKKDPSWDTNDPENWQLYWKADEPKDAPSDEFLDWWWKRTTDIIDNYEPDLLWFDFGFDKPGWESVHKPILAYYYNKGLEWDKEVVLQGKNMNKTSRVNGKFFHDTSVKSFPEDLIVLDLERGRMSDIRDLPWQTDTATSKDTWSYVEGQEFKTSGYLLDELIDIVSKNGCLLLNVGPKADGTITEEETRILKEMGAWLKRNGEAIYGTRPWKIFGEGPTEVQAGNHSEHENPDNVAADIRFTQKEDELYAISLAWPDGGRFTIESLARGNPYEEREVESVHFLSGERPAAWKQTTKGLRIDAGSEKPCEAAYVFRIKFSD
ncbi:alpha-L-fucosidase [Pelagicoccus mobilis]|uniref:alpha-L-fucosidase n=2 Tax=Pelagicoccus mobilis TaxID=415221 RepID=A0A934RUR9_9BACT|nr:alpha-L-fucosidase [Pelagicoccus mobilis]